MFSIILPIDSNRLEQFKETKRVYDAMPEKKEFIMPTRTYPEVFKYFKDNDLMKDVFLFNYDIDTPGFNCSKALNLGVSRARYRNIIISSPEIKPTTDVLSQFKELEGKNVLAQVFDQDEEGNLTSLICKGYRDDSPAMYFLAMFRKVDIKAINGWDEEFMKGYAYEDNDFGERWKRAKLPWEVHDEIQAIHQYHLRGEYFKGASTINQQHFYNNTDQGIIKCKNGLNKL